MTHIVTTLLLSFVISHASFAAVRPRPNIVFILADDYGFAELGANGADHYKTPNIDSLAKTGIRFNHFYTAPLCGPSRALILTGRYAQVYHDNISYMDKLVGKLLAELDRLRLRENTVIFFMGDNGTAKANADRATIGGRRLIGQKGGMEEGGGLVPFIVSWQGVTPAGKLNENMSDASDLLPTFAELAGAPLPEDRIIDGKSMVRQIKGETQPSRTWAFTQLGEHWHVREAGWKLNEGGQLFDMENAPFEEIPVPAESKDLAAVAARKRLGDVLARLDPAAGIKAEGSSRSDKTKKRKP